MRQKTALITNVKDYVGPPAVDALHRDGFTFIAQDASFSEQSERDAFQEQYPNAIPVDIDDPDELIALVWKTFSHVDVIISNDAYPAIHTPIESAKLDDLQATIQSVLVQPFRLAQAAIPRLKAQQCGNVIMVTSCRSELPLPGGAIPDMARAGANAFVKSLSIELAPHGIPVNAIAPNYLYSEAYFPKAKFIDDPKGSSFIQDVVPAKRLGKPEEMEELVSYLANMKGAFHTGTIIKFAGGWPAAPLRPE